MDADLLEARNVNNALWKDAKYSEMTIFPDHYQHKGTMKCMILNKNKNRWVYNDPEIKEIYLEGSNVNINNWKNRGGDDPKIVSIDVDGVPKKA